MQLRNGAIAGGSPGVLPPHVRPAFEEGVRLVLGRWTALALAVENEWGGPASAQKAEQLLADVLQWFHNNRGAWLSPF